MFRRGVSKQLIELGKNPVAGLMTRPKIDARETPWLEVTEAADILEYARAFISPRPDLAVPYFYVILAVCF